MSDQVEFEYGVRYIRDPEDWSPHRSNMTEEQARRWIDEWVDEGGEPDAFVLVRRTLGPWEDA